MYFLLFENAFGKLYLHKYTAIMNLILLFRRVITSSSLDGVCAVINNACGILEKDYCNVLRNQLKQGYPSGYLDLTQAYNVLQSSIQQGRLQSSDTEHAKTMFIVST